MNWLTMTMRWLTTARTQPYKLKILLANLEQGAEVTSGYVQYFFNSLKYFLPHNLTQTQRFRDFLSKQSYDLALFTEDTTNIKGSDGLGQFITNQPLLAEWQNSWGESISMYSDQPKPYLRSKIKQLSSNRGLVIIELTDYVIALTHLSLWRKATRKKQVDEIIFELNNYSKPIILCGDFNDTSLFISGFKKIKIPATYPSWNPKKSLLNVYVKGDVEITAIEILPIRFSDHLSIFFTIK